MKISSVNQINFQKKLVAKSGVIKEGKNKRVQIYELDRELDKRYFEKALYNSNWINKSYYLADIDEEFETAGSNQHFYVMEDKKGRLLGFSLLTRNENDILEYLETCPKYSINSGEKRKIRYIGETMLAFLSKLSQKANRDLCVFSIAPRKETFDFYYKYCGFEQNPSSKDIKSAAILKKENIENLIKQNEAHTNSSIELFI